MAYRQDLLLKQKRLLNQFYRRYNPYERNDTPEIQAVRSEYNWLVDQVQQHHHPRPKLPDPFDALPPEILLQCFSEVPHDRSDGLFALLQVSRKWRYFLMSASSFWTQISIGQGAGNRRRVEMALLYSQKAPLTLEIFLQPQQEGWWVDLLHPHADRIREIYFRHHALYDGDYSMRQHLFPAGLRALRRLSPCLPALETLAYVNGQQSYLPKISGEDFPSMPALRTMIGFDLGHEILTLSTFPANKLSRFSTTAPVRDLVPLLYQCSQLEQLYLEETFEITRAFGERVEVIDESIDIAQLPALKMLSFTRNNVAAMRPILTLRGFNITELYLKLRWFDMVDLSYLFLANLWIDAVTSDANQATTSTFTNPARPPPATSSTDSPLNGQRFSNVTTLTWDGSISWGNVRQCSTITTSFTSIKTLIFAEAYARKDSNDFCAALIRSPTSCPHLTTISFHCYPSWDLLFHMLLRRNIMPGSPVAPLKNIQLPGYPARSLLQPLTGLLAGKLSLIPAISEIALTFRNGLFDSSKAGCDCCLDCGLTCQVPVQVIDPQHVVSEQPNLLGDCLEGRKSGDSESDDSSTDADFDSTEMEYNLIEPLKAWFDTWPQRRKAWNDYSESWGLKYRRSFACGKHDFVNLVTITGSMLRGV
ncbi:hypothetical protein FRC17_007293 [Serendipita sp. 399]|nr:hypothetical protein FRC17_007293 [Serendipita sp. 399]